MSSRGRLLKAIFPAKTASARMHRFIILLLFGCSLALAFNGSRYNPSKYFLFYQWKVHTADVYGAGTDSNMRFEFGWLNATNHLIWWTENMDWQHPQSSALERGSVNKFHAIYKEQRFVDAESRCAAETKAFAEYQSCLLHPNIMFVKMKPYTQHFIELFDMGGWKMYLLELETNLNYWRNGEWANALKSKSNFYASPHTEDGWTQREGYYLLKMNGKNGHEVMMHGFPKRHKIYDFYV